MNEKMHLQCDLHTHSIFSDGTCTPGEIVAEAKRLGLIVALTDHNTVDGLPEFMEAAKKLNVTAVPGVEFSTEYGGKELHLVGLFIQPQHYTVVKRLVKERSLLKELSNMELVERLNQAGFDIDYQVIKRRNPTGNTNRAHIAAELMNKGYVKSISEAFDSLLAEDGEFYVSPAHLQILEVISTLRSIGAVPVLAHPLEDLTEAELREILPTLKEAGLLAIETMHSSYTNEVIKRAEQIAAEFGMMASGGSDFHGTVKPDIFLGQGKGNLCIPSTIYWKLLEQWEGGLQ